MNQASMRPEKSVKSAVRALEILDILTREGRPLAFAEFLRILGYPKASLHALLQTMTAARWLHFDDLGRTYALGVRVWESGIAYSAMAPIESRARPFLEKVRDLTTETVQLAVLENFEVLYVDKVDGRHLLRLDSSVGLRLEPHATGVGKVLLASLPKDVLAEWLKGRTLERYTPNTITRPSHLLRELAKVRRLGHASDTEERTLGASCVAVGVHNARGECIAAMSVSAPAVRFGQAKRAKALRHLQAAADGLSAALGFQGAPVKRKQKDH